MSKSPGRCSGLKRTLLEYSRCLTNHNSKVHFLLVSTLNSAFPEYDFSALRPDHFVREISVPQVLANLSSNLLAINAVDLSP